MGAARSICHSPHILSSWVNFHARVQVKTDIPYCFCAYGLPECRLHCLAAAIALESFPSATEHCGDRSNAQHANASSLKPET